MGISTRTPGALSVDRDNFSLILDRFRMHMKETDPAQAILSHWSSLHMRRIFYSNRGRIGSEQIDCYHQFCALKETGYQAQVMLEVILSQRTPRHALATAAQWQALSKPVSAINSCG